MFEYRRVVKPPMVTFLDGYLNAIRRSLTKTADGLLKWTVATADLGRVAAFQETPNLCNIFISLPLSEHRLLETRCSLAILHQARAPQLPAFALMGGALLPLLHFVLLSSTFLLIFGLKGVRAQRNSQTQGNRKKPVLDFSRFKIFIDMSG